MAVVNFTYLVLIARHRGTTKDAGDRVGRSLFAEVASCQLEYKYLAHLTGRQDFFQKVGNERSVGSHNAEPRSQVDHIVTLMEKSQNSNDIKGLWQLQWMTDNAVQVGSESGPRYQSCC